MPPPSSPPMDLEKIISASSMLHLIFHRNKNQHGSSKWWKWLSILKRTTSNLASALEYEQNHGIPGGKGKESESAVGRYRGYLAGCVVPRCYLAFSTVVADGQFSTLGTVLIAVLARLAKATGIDRVLKSAPPTEKVTVEPSLKDKAPKEDLGEVVSRPKPRPVDGKSKTPKSESSASKDISKKKNTEEVDTEAKEKAPKKKKRKKNAIDDIFAGF